MKLATLCYVKDRKKGKTLMLHRVKKEQDMHEGKWNGLGGKFEQGETPEECVIREVREESGLTIKNPMLKGVLTFPLFSDQEDWRVFIFVAEDFEGQVIPSEDANEGDLEWVDDSELQKLNLWEGDRIFMNWLDGKGFFSGKFVYENKKLKDHKVVFYGD